MKNMKNMKNNLGNFNKCSICLDKIYFKKNTYTTICNHIYHKSCINKWLNISKTCPICREVLVNTNSYTNTNSNTNTNNLYYTIINYDIDSNNDFNLNINTVISEEDIQDNRINMKKDICILSIPIIIILIFLIF